MNVLITLNALANRCGHFYNDSFNDLCGERPLVNNGYNCNHPDCEEISCGVGMCLGSCCPVAYRSDGRICQKCSVECEQCGDEDCDCDDDYMVWEIDQKDFDTNCMVEIPDD